MVVSVGIGWVIFLAYVLRIGLNVEADELWTARNIRGFVPHFNPLQFMIAPFFAAVGSIALTSLIERRRVAARADDNARTDS